MSAGAPRALGRTGAMLGLALACASCTSLVTPPRAPRDPTSVFLLREARHVGVVLPAHVDGRVERYVEFGFGDWAWYALERDAWYDVFATVLWPTTGALCRREHPARSERELRAAAHWTELEELTVSRARAEALLERLEREFAARAARSVRIEAYDMSFAPSDRSYWFGDTCADVAADWLEELGCGVSRAPIRMSVRKRGSIARSTGDETNGAVTLPSSGL